MDSVPAVTVFRAEVRVRLAVSVSPANDRTPSVTVVVASVTERICAESSSPEAAISVATADSSSAAELRLGVIPLTSSTTS